MSLLKASLLPVVGRTLDSGLEVKNAFQQIVNFRGGEFDAGQFRQDLISLQPDLADTLNGMNNNTITGFYTAVTENPQFADAFFDATQDETSMANLDRFIQANADNPAVINGVLRDAVNGDMTAANQVLTTGSIAPPPPASPTFEQAANAAPDAAVEADATVESTAETPAVVEVAADAADNEETSFAPPAPPPATEDLVAETGDNNMMMEFLAFFPEDLQARLIEGFEGFQNGEFNFDQIVELVGEVFQAIMGGEVDFSEAGSVIVDNVREAASNIDGGLGDAITQGIDQVADGLGVEVGADNDNALDGPEMETGLAPQSSSPLSPTGT